MKIRCLFVVVWVLGSFAAGWALRGVSKPPRFAEAGGALSGAGRMPPGRRVDDGMPTKRPRAAAEAFTEADRQREVADRERLAARCRAALERQIAEWERLLGLDAGEVAELRQLIEAVVLATEPPMVALALPALEERLRELLDADRQAAFDELESRRGQARLRAKVQARLAELNSVLLLDAGQERALGELLLAQGALLPDPSAGWTADLTPADLAEVTRRLAEAGDDGSGFAVVAGEVIREGIEVEIRRLAEVLSGDQVAAYRAHLEEKHARWLPVSP